MINVALLHETMLKISAEPWNHFQGEWVTSDPRELPIGNDCGTALCFGGWAVVLDGCTINSDHRRWIRCVTPEGETVLIEVQARIALGLTDDEAEWLFDANNTVDDLRSIVDRLTERAKAQLQAQIQDQLV